MATYEVLFQKLTDLQRSGHLFINQNKNANECILILYLIAHCSDLLRLITTELDSDDSTSSSIFNNFLTSIKDTDTPQIIYTKLLNEVLTPLTHTTTKTKQPFLSYLVCSTVCLLIGACIMGLTPGLPLWAVICGAIFMIGGLIALVAGFSYNTKPDINLLAKYNLSPEQTRIIYHQASETSLTNQMWQSWFLEKAAENNNAMWTTLTPTNSSS